MTLEVWEEDPSVQSFTDLLKRALAEPGEQKRETTIIRYDELIAKLHAQPTRIAKRRTNG